MKSETLLVLAGSRKEFDRWTRDWGQRLYNKTIVNVDGAQSISRWEEHNTFFVLLKDFRKRKNWEDLYWTMRNAGYKEVMLDRLEERLKKVTVRQMFTEN